MSHYSADFGRALATAMHAQREAVFAQQEVEHLRAELAQRTADRDEARRLYCHAQARIPDGREEQLAQTLGWDCFKKGTEQC